jgi:diguanylate cyclase (GGDEF)-like protein/PAS domain S-box-containing protein
VSDTFTDKLLTGVARGPQARRIQIVEDERIFALDLKETIEALGFEVTGTAASGEEAIRIADRDRPDLILMDIQLDGCMDGIEAALQISQSWRIPVVFLTAFDEPSRLKDASHSAPYGYLLKPIETRQLRSVLTMALARREAELITERSHERLQLALDAGAMIAWEWANGESWVSDQSAQAPPGISEVLSLGKAALIERIHPDERAVVTNELNEVDHLVDAQVRLMSEDGRHRWVDLRARVYASSLGKGTRVIGVACDVTARRKVLERLRQAEAAIEAVGDGVVILDADRRAISVNSAFTKLTDYAAEDVIGHQPDHFLRGHRSSDQNFPSLEEMAGGFWRRDLACRRKKGGVFPAIQTVFAVTNPAGAVTNYVLSIADVSAVRNAEAKMEHEAQHDALTGLGNRRLMQERLDKELVRARRLDLPLGVLFLDLDDFKTINDSMGHESGDIVLKNVAARIEDCIRRNDLAIRIGGDEFLIVVPAQGQAECIGLAKKILERIAQPLMLGGEPVSITGSIGIALYPLHGTNTAELAQAADNAMYEAKRDGRNRFAVYTEVLAGRARDRMLIEQGLRRGLARGEIHAHYQPIVRLRDYRIVGFEALARWSHPSLGPVSPDRFIPIAESSELIGELGEVMLRQTCAEFARWGSLGIDEPALSVNVSVRQVLGSDLVSLVLRTLEETGFPARRLTLEMTESVLHKQDDSGRRILERLQKIGVSVAIDDFGTGYSSLSLLNRLPIDAIKIDRSFVTALQSDPKATAIIRAILIMARSLGVKVTAEGIETQPQLAELVEQECSLGQGYLFSPGVDGQAAFELAAARHLNPGK